MNRRVFLTRCASGVLGAVLAGGAATAGSYEDSVVGQLRGQGYRDIDVARTMLGRVRIVGTRRGATREIILNPRTGEILRDVLMADDGGVAVQIGDDGSSGKGSSGSDGSGSDGSGSDGSDGGGGDSGSDGGGGDSGSDGGSDGGGDGED